MCRQARKFIEISEKPHFQFLKAEDSSLVLKFLLLHRTEIITNFENKPTAVLFGGQDSTKVVPEAETKRQNFPSNKTKHFFLKYCQ
jgi:hypothetical protein